MSRCESCNSEGGAVEVGYGITHVCSNHNCPETIMTSKFGIDVHLEHYSNKGILIILEKNNQEIGRYLFDVQVMEMKKL